MRKFLALFLALSLLVGCNSTEKLVVDKPNAGDGKETDIQIPSSLLNQTEHDPLEWTSESEFMEILDGEWVYTDRNLCEDVVWITFHKDGQYELKVKDHRGSQCVYSGNFSIGSMVQGDESTDTIELELKESDDPYLNPLSHHSLGKYSITQKALCDDKLILELIQMNSGDGIFSLLFDDAYPVLRKTCDLPTVSQPRKGESFIAAAWKLDTNQKTIWLDDYALEGVLIPEGRFEAVPYHYDGQIDLDYLAYCWGGSLMCEVITDETGVITDITIFHEGYAEEFTVDDAMEVLKTYETVQLQLEQGMTMMDSGQTMEVDNVLYYIIAVGRDNLQQFVTENYYAISSTGNALCYDAEGDAWLEVGFG